MPGIAGTLAFLPAREETFREEHGNIGKNCCDSAIFSSMEGLSVGQAADRLGISPQRVRAMLQAGRLLGHKVGRNWVVSPEAFPHRRGHSGRPLNASNAWALLALLAGDSPDWVNPSVRSRLRRRVRDGAWLERSLRESKPRSQVHRWRLLPDDLRKLSGEVRIVASGLSTAHPDLDVVATTPELDAYVDGRSMEQIEQRFKPDRAPVNPNLIIRLPSHPWILSYRAAPTPVVAADLLSADDPRVARAARQLLRRLSDA